MYGLIHQAEVLTPDPTTGDYTVVANSALACRLTHVPTDSAKDAHERAELASVRRLLWDPSYVMPEDARVYIASLDSGSQYWGLVAGTFSEIFGLGGQIVYRRAEAVRAA